MSDITAFGGLPNQLDQTKEIIIIGAGGVGKGICQIIKDINKIKFMWDIIGFIDEDEGVSGKMINGIPVLGTIDTLQDPRYVDCYVVFAIGDPEAKERIIQKVMSKHPNLYCATLIHPSAIISDEAEIGYGTVVNALVVIEPDSIIGNHVLIYYGCTVGHDSIIEDYSSLLPQSNVSGNAILKKCTNLGSNSTVIQGIEVGEYTVIGAGAVVTKSLPNRCTAVGVPAKAIKYRGIEVTILFE